LTPIARLKFSFALLVGAMTIAYFLGSSPNAIFFWGLSLMLLLPATLASLIDMVRAKAPLAQASPTNPPGPALLIPVGALALSSLLIGGYVLVVVSIEFEALSWGNLLAGLIAGAVFIGFATKLLLLMWNRLHAKSAP
jgi:hypothetical protein